MSNKALQVTARITVDSVLTQWEEETKIKLPLAERDLLLMLFSVLVGEAVDIAIEETMKKWESEARKGVVTH